MNRKYSIIALIIGLLAAVPAHAQSGFQIVVNDANPIDRLAAADIARIFLRQQTTWRNGSSIVPISSSTSPERK